MTHEPQATDSAARVASQVDDQACTFELRNCASDVARDVDSQHAGEHADAHIAYVRIQLARTHHLIGYDDGSLLFAGSWNRQSWPHRGAIRLAHHEGVRLAKSEGSRGRRDELLIVDRKQDVTGPDAGRGGHTAGMNILKHPALTVFSRIRLRQRCGHRDSAGGTWPRLVEKSCVARLQVSEQAVKRLLKILQSATADHSRSVHVAKLAHVNIGAAELCIDQADHLVKNGATLRFGQEGHLFPP